MKFIVMFSFLLSIGLTPSWAATESTKQCSPRECLGGIEKGAAGFLVVAPDRGYMGNQRVRKAFKELKSKRNAELVFVTDRRMKPYLKKALRSLEDQGAEHVVVLPLFYSMSHPKLELFRTFLPSVTEGLEATYARSFGNTYLAVEMLIERMSEVKFSKKNPLLVYGHGAMRDRHFRKMNQDIKQIAELAIKDFGDKAVYTTVFHGDRYSKNYILKSEEIWDNLKTLAEDTGIKYLMPLHFGPEYDGHMSEDAWTEKKLPPTLKLAPFTQNETEFFSLWMQREANRYLSAKEAQLGIVFHAHGYDFHWNQKMKDAVIDIAEEYPMEFAFSMADPEDLRAAVSRLERRGAGVIIIVRVFGMRASFRHGVEHLIGLDVDAPELCKVAEGEDGHDGDPPKRLRTNAIVVTEGGLGDSKLFAQAMLDRAGKLSKTKSKDTVIVVAHGKKTDAANRQWLKTLKSLTSKMKAEGGDQFKAIHYQTWQEDWKDKRGKRIDSVKEMVRLANKDGGHAIIIPARTTGKGRSKRFLKGEKFIAGEGFAPHPLFNEWVIEQLRRGADTVRQTRHVWYPALPKK